MTRDHEGNSALLLSSCIHNDDGVDPERYVQKLKLLSKEGYSIHDIDWYGSTCLHVFFGSFIPPISMRTWKASLIYLIRHGANLSALDRSGRSVFDIAYTETCRDRDHGLGTYRSDLLDFVLYSCRYSLCDYRKERLRERRYGFNYSRQDFEFLWKGQEYPWLDWNDEKRPIFYQNTDNNDESSHQTLICTCGPIPCELVLERCWSEDDEEDDNSEDFEMQEQNLQASHRLSENDGDGTKFQDCLPTTDWTYHDFFSVDGGPSTQGHWTEETSQQNEGQGFPELPSSARQLSNRYGMDWSSTNIIAPVPLKPFPYYGDDQHYNAFSEFTGE